MNQIISNNETVQKILDKSQEVLRLEVDLGVRNKIWMYVYHNVEIETCTEVYVPVRNEIMNL